MSQQQLGLLYQLQQMETDIRQKKKRLAELVELQKESPELVAARTKKEATEATLKEYQSQHSHLEREIEQVRHKKDESSTRLYSGEMKNTKEMSDMELAIGAMERRIGTLEGQLLELLGQIEEAEIAAGSGMEVYKNLLAKWAQGVNHYKKEHTAIAMAVNEQLADRQAQLQRIAPSLLTEYKKIAQKLGGIAIVRVNEGRCEGCQVGLSGKTIREVEEGMQVNCGSCGRLLYA